MNRRLLWRMVALATLGAAVAMAYLMRDRFAIAALQGWIDGAGVLGPAVYMAVYAVATVLFLPGSVITLAGGALFGPVWGTLYSLSGATIGATAAFFIATSRSTSRWISCRGACQSWSKCASARSL